MPTLVHPPGHSDSNPPGPRSPLPPAGPFAPPQALTTGRPQAEQRQQSQHAERQGPLRHCHCSLFRRFPECPSPPRTPPFIPPGTHGQSWRGAAAASSVSGQNGSSGVVRARAVLSISVPRWVGERPGQRPGDVGQQRLDVSPGGQWHLVWTSSRVATGPGQRPSPVLGTAAAIPQILASVLCPPPQEGY